MEGCGLRHGDHGAPLCRQWHDFRRKRLTHGYAGGVYADVFSMKQLPNALTIMRIALAIFLLILPAPGRFFLCVYLLCGVTDVLDGWIAHHYHAESMLGAKLDSAADFTVIIILLWRLYPIVAPGIVVQNALGLKLKLNEINSSPLNTNSEMPCKFTFEVLN